MKAELVVIMNNKLKLLTVEADRTKRGIIGAQVCCGMLKYAQLSYPQISIRLSERMCEQSEESGIFHFFKTASWCSQLTQENQLIILTRPNTFASQTSRSTF